MQKGAFQIAFGCCCRRLPRVIGLNRAGGDQHVSTTCDGIADEEFEFAGLVAATLQAGQVVSFNPQFLAVQLLTEVFQLVYRCGQLR